MTDKEKLAKVIAEIKRLYNQSLADENRQADRGLEGAAKVSYGKSIVCKELLSFIDSMQEEPVSEDLEEAAKRYATEGDEISGLYIINEEVDAFKAGSNWQKEQMRKWLEDFCNEHYIMSYSDSHEVRTKELMEIFIKKMEE